MIYDTAPDFSRQNYPGFVHDLAELVTKGQGFLREYREESSKLAARASLPRPARFKGPKAPSARRLAWLSVAQKATPEDVLRHLRDWTEDRFAVDKYRSLVQAASGDGSELSEAINSLVWNGDRLFLDHVEKCGYWSFGLSEEELDFATTAMGWVRAMANDAILAINRIPSTPHFARLAKWFFFGRKSVEQAVLPEIATKFGKVSTALLPGRDTVVLCKADTRLASGRRAEAYVGRSPVEMGAMTFLGDSYFQPPAKGYAGTERALYRAATLLHELTHLFAATEDVAGDNSYGRLNCSKLVPAKQRENADNYGLFAFEVSRSMVFEQGLKLSDDMEFVLTEFKV
jgi:Lysine-specific metallo-endopeptidase